MDNIETILYLVIGVAILVSRILKARKKAAPPRPGQTPPTPAQGSQQPHQPKKTFSFEDILKEFEQNLSGEEEYEEPAPVREVKQEIPQPVVVPPQERQPRRYEAFEGTSFSSKIGKSDDDQQPSTFARSEKYSIKQDIVNDYVKMLQEPDGFKNAIVLSEIINRKYF